MNDICVGLGFCGSVDADGTPKHVDDYIPEAGPVSAQQFAEWLMLADGMEPFDGSSYQADFRKLFVKHMGAEVVDASELDWFEPIIDAE